MVAAPDLPRDIAPGAIILAAGLPILLLHVSFQPGVSIALHGTTVSAYLSDFVVLAIVLAAAASWVVNRTPLAAGRAIWIAAAAFFVWVVFGVLWGRHATPGYDLAARATTAAKFLEYALLALAVPLLVRRRNELLLVLWSLALWSAVASVVGTAQFFGSHIAGGKGVAGHRQASFLSDADFAALSTCVLLLGLLAYALPRARIPRALAVVACLAGALGTILAAAVASILGLATALVVVAVPVLRHRASSTRRVAVVIVVALVTMAGVVAIRAGDLAHFARFTGVSQHEGKQANVQTYSQHTLLVWIGYRIWRAHPVLGAGWEASAEPGAFVPVLPAAHRRFPNEATQAFPAAQPVDRRYGVQNVWVQALADLGVVGFVLWVGVFGSAAVTAARRLPQWPMFLALGLVPLLAWLWSAQGFVAGIPLDALTWVGFGLAATTLEAV